MVDHKHPMTTYGKLQLEKELKRLLQEERPAIIQSIEEARSHGDLSENADYDAAKERQAFAEARIGELQGKIAGAEVIDPSQIHEDHIVFGAHVILEDPNTEERSTYQLVGEDEANVKEGKISVFSPLARSMIGKKEGDSFELRSPKGVREFKVIKLFFQ